MQQNYLSHKTDPAIENTSGQGFSAAVPPDIEGWNWGAFFLTWIWGIGNRVWLSFLALIPIPLVGLAMMVLLGIKGNEWAWQCKKWDSIEQFRQQTAHLDVLGYRSFCSAVCPYLRAGIDYSGITRLLWLYLTIAQ